MATEMAVNALLYQRARRRGDKERALCRLRVLQPQAAELKAQVDALEQSIAKADADVAALTEALKLGFNHQEDDGHSRKTYPKVHLTGWGGLTRVILSLLRNGRVATADVIAEDVARHFGLHFEDKTSHQAFRRQIGRTLKNMKHRGLVQGHHDRHANLAGIWSLLASGE